MSAGDGAGATGPPSLALLESLVEDSDEFVVVVDDDFAIAYTNSAVQPILGYVPAEAIGRSAVDFIHPDDLERALDSFAASAAFGVPGGATSFRILRADGTYRPYDITAAGVTDGDRSFIALYGWSGDFQWATEQMMLGLLESRPLEEVLAWVLDVFEWRLNDAHAAISWVDGTGQHHNVTTGLPLALTGGEPEPGEPWARARRDHEAVLVDGPDDLDRFRRTLATDRGRGGFWIEPITVTAVAEPVLVTLSSRAGGPDPTEHVHGMELARTYVELVFRWTAQVGQLAEAVSSDALTGAANRRALFELLDREVVSGAVLYCDLDRFKEVNDRHGHHVGDAVLRAVADRARACIGPHDLVARIGGDEFVIVARDIDDDEAAALAARLEAAVGRPIVVDGSAIQIGVSVGVGPVADRLTEAHLVAADEAQIVAKHHTRTARR